MNIEAPSPASGRGLGLLRSLPPWARDLWQHARSRLVGALRLGGLLAAVSVGFVVIASQVHTHYPIQQWLFWRYAAAIALTGTWALGCTGVGLRLLAALRPASLRPLELVVTAFGLGTLAFALSLFLIGLGGGFGPVCFIATPLCFLALGTGPLYRYARRWFAHGRALASRFGASLRFRDFALLCAGLLGLLFLYAMILHPGNVHFDSRWYHLALAEHYVAAGGIEPTREGWFLSAYPQLATLIYTWAFQLPGATQFDQVTLCGHIEYAVVLATLLLIPVLVRRVLRRRVPLAWVATFLFPGVFLYGSGLHVNAERFAALFDTLGVFALIVSWRNYSVRGLVLTATFFGAALLTKYTALALAFVPIVAITLRGLWLVAFSGEVTRKRALLALSCAAATGLLVTSPHWLKNWLWYGDPLYPLLHRHLAVQPWTADAVAPFENWFYSAEFRAPRTLDGVLETLQALGTFSFVPHNFGVHGRVPVFGFLFTASTLCLPFVRAPRLLWALFGVCYGALFFWYWLHHFDRYLQILLPCLVVASLSVLLLAWRTHMFARVGVAALVALQVIWGGDVPFIPSHSMLHASAPSAAAEFLASGYKGDREGRLRPFGVYSQIGRALPEGAVTLLHEELLSLGIGSRRVSDCMGTQGAISYGQLGSSREVDELLRGLGVTHVVADRKRSRSHASLASDFMFYSWLEHTIEARYFGSLTLSKMPLRAPETESSKDAVVAVLGCKPRGYAAGTYLLRDLNRSAHESTAPFPAPRAPLRSTPGDYVAPADVEFVVTFEGCAIPGRLKSQGFRELVRRNEETLWVR